MDPQYQTVELDGHSVINTLRVCCPVLQDDHGWHYHPECELTFVVSGQGMRFVGDSMQRFEAGDLVLCGSNLPHCWRNDQSAELLDAENELLVVQFRPDCLGDDFLCSPDAKALRDLLQSAARGIRFSPKLGPVVAAQMQSLIQERGLTRLASFMMLLEILVEAEPEEYLSSELSFGDTEAFHGGRMVRILDYLKENLTEEIKQSEIAALVGMSPQGFSRFFRATTGRTFVSFVNVMRIMEACRLLISSDDDIIDIAFACGYSNLSNFNRRFIELKQTTPRNYRLQHSQLSG